ncbi:MAG: hypothetical protein II333_04030 [Clostridia bacterium]|nr:hypothetical protein [Clostridia bacterium]
MKGEMNRVVMVYVDSYEDENPMGRFCIAANGEIQTFQSTIQLIKKIEEQLDKTRFPQAFDAIRKFQTPHRGKCSEDEPTDTRPGSKATFAVRLLFRQNASWQGSVRWIEGGQEESFRSVLELLLLMDNALSYRVNKKIS